MARYREEKWKNNIWNIIDNSMKNSTKSLPWIRNFFEIEKEIDSSEDSSDNNYKYKYIRKDMFINTYPTWKTIYQRHLLRQSLDDCCFFEWDNTNAFDAFGAFIINDKRDNFTARTGRDFSNKYIKTEYEENSHILEGIDFKNKEIKIKVGLYWISEEHYQSFLNWLDPYKVGLLFLNNSDYGYQVKLSNIKDGKKFYIGKENTIVNIDKQYSSIPSDYFYKDENNNIVLYEGKDQKINQNEIEKDIDMFYIEIDLTFELIGEKYCICKYNYPFNFDRSLFKWDNNVISDIPGNNQSDLPVEFDISFSLEYNKDNIVLENISNKENRKVSASIYYNKDNHNSIDINEEPYDNLFEFYIYENFLKEKEKCSINLNYNSGSGRITWSNDSIKKELNTLSTFSGLDFIESLIAKRFILPGKFQFFWPYDNIKIKIDYNQNIFTLKDVKMNCKPKKIST